MAEPMTLQSIRSEVVKAVGKLKERARGVYGTMDLSGFAQEADEILTALLGPVMLRIKHQDALISEMGRMLEEKSEMIAEATQAFDMAGKEVDRIRAEASAAGPTDPPLWAIQEAREIVSWYGAKVNDALLPGEVVHVARRLVELTDPRVAADFEVTAEDTETEPTGERA